MKIAVIGAGAIGGYYGGKLAHAGVDVHFVVRGDLSDLRRHGLRILGEDEDIRITGIKCYKSAAGIGACDLVLIAVKTISNRNIVDLVAPLLQPATMVMTLQNGLGNEEFFAQQFGAERILGGLCFICLNRKSRTLVERYDSGRLSVGEYLRKPLPRTHAVVQLFQHAGVSCQLVD
ncbi:MAG: 2-dehydropantoate 2-reductase, partial [Verrucomicrobiaceae bacterium]|nr:2-dehydropantoate 2-reductase [Verrucomicrobiaceae bacterium]